MKNPLFQTKYGIYEPNCGLGRVHLSFGHDGYIYEVMKNYMPEESLYMLRYHSFYAAHRLTTICGSPGPCTSRDPVR